ncbi:MAG: hypothetical protein AAF702_49495 [Chloroflexota bacterium]
MAADTQTLDRIFGEARLLSPENRLRLVQRILQTLVSFSTTTESQPLQFGEFGGTEADMSTMDDFAAKE